MDRQAVNGRRRQPELLAEGFTLTRVMGDYTRSAVCEAWTHIDGLELRLAIDGFSLPTTTVVRSYEAMRQLIETWRTALLEKGWIDAISGRDCAE